MFAGLTPRLDGQPAAREMAVTFDDLPASRLPQSVEAADRLTRQLLTPLARHNIPAIGFVNEAKLYVDGKLDSNRVALLQRWIEAGLELGNHTYSYLDLHRAPVDEYRADIERGDEVTG